MDNWYGEAIRRKQTELGQRIGAVIFYSLPPPDPKQLPASYNILIDLHPSDTAAVREMDIATCSTMFRLGLGDAAVKVVISYTNWMAGALTRSGNLKPQTLPALDGETITKIAAKYTVKSLMAEKVIQLLERPGTEVPQLGKIHKNRWLVTNEDQIRTYASYFAC